jgi:hypothetical protein
MTATRSGSKSGPPDGEIVPRRSKRAYSPSSAGFDSEAIRQATEASLCSNLKASKKTATTRSTKGKKWEGGKMKRTQVVTPDGKKQTHLAKLRSRYGYDTGVQNEEDSKASEVASNKAARMPSTKRRSNDSEETSGKARKNKKIKMFAGYKSANGALQNVDKRSVLEQLEEDSDSIPDSMFPDWVPESNDTDEE